MTSTVAQERPTSLSAARTDTLLEVQALRALAVLLVVIYHVWPNRLPGGFIGVDVFFVISGFLITAHLMRDYDRSGRILLTQFWARRIRRLLPAAFLVLGVCVVLLLTVLPEVVRANSLQQVAGASGYVLNWMLGFDSVDYLAAGNQATLVQHYWTLSVEEQFYIGWPVLLVAVGWAIGRIRHSEVRPQGAKLFGWTAAVIVVVSLGYSIYLTWYSPAFAYFATTTRAWEFAGGALLAASVALWPDLLTRIRASALVRATSLPTLLGGVIIVVSAFLLSGASPFPGWLAAFPVVGTGLIIIGGMPQGLGLGAAVGFRPVQFIGDVSYSLYLWHWPVIIVFGLLAGRGPSALEGVAIILVSVLLAAATKYLLEDPARKSKFFTKRRLPAYALALGGALILTTISATTSFAIAAQSEADRAATVQQEQDPAGCYGANAMLGTVECPERFMLGDDVNLAAAASDLDTANWCLTWFDQDWSSCELGDVSGPQGTYALVGDSHAASMTAALGGYFAENGVKLVTYTRFGCSGLSFDDSDVDGQTEQGKVDQACVDWSKRVQAEILDRGDIDKVIYLNFSSSYLTAAPRAVTLHPEEMASIWQDVIDSGKGVISLRDTPNTIGTNIPTCLSSHVGETAPCSTLRADSVPVDPVDEAVQLMEGTVQSVNSTDAFCDETRCYAAIGGVVVYADHNHITSTYARTLLPYIGPQLLARR